MRAAHCERKAFCIAVSRVLGVQHIVQGRYFSVLVGDLKVYKDASTINARNT